MPGQFFEHRVVAAARSLGRRTRREGGFTLVESVAATAVFAIVLVGLFGTLTVGVRGLLTGRQRSAATAVAKQVIEEIRSASYDRIGHDLAEPGLSSDPALTGTAPNYVYTGTAEPLVGGGADPVVPEHRWQGTLDGTAYDVVVYVTQVTPLDADPHKRVTVVVEFEQPQYDSSTIENLSRLSTLVFDGDNGGAGTPTTAPGGGGGSGSQNPGCTSLSELKGVGAPGWLTLAGAIGNSTVSDLRLTYPKSWGQLSHHQAHQVHGHADTAALRVVDPSAQIQSGTGCTDSGNEIRCDAARAQTLANDVKGVYDQDDVSRSSWTLAGGSAYTLAAGATSADSRSDLCAGLTFCALGAPFGPSPYPPEDDGLLNGLHTGVGPEGVTVDFDAGDHLSGTLISVGGDARSWAWTDQQSGMFRSWVRNTYPTIDLLALDHPFEFEVLDDLDACELIGGILHCEPADLALLEGPVVSISGFSVTGKAEVGSTATAPRVEASSDVSVTLLGGVGVPTTFTPGEDEVTLKQTIWLTSGGFADDPTLVFVEVEVSSKAAQVDSDLDNGTYRQATARLPDQWLVISMSMVAARGGSVLADVEITLDYGDLVACGSYQTTAGLPC